jgi:hypothetical protein
MTGCVSKALDARLETNRASVSAQIRELDDSHRAGDTMSLDWKTALKILEERNLSLRQSRIRIQDLKKARDEQWKTWVPRVGIYANLLSSLAELGSLSSGDLNASVVAPLNIPNPVTERAQAFANALSYLEGVDSLELNYRRQVSALYRIFSRYDSLLAREAAGTPQDERAESVSDALGSLESSASHRESVGYLRENLAQLLNLPGQSPTPVPGTRPDLNYEKRIGKLVPGKNYGMLATRLSAYQIEAALLREKGVEMRQWPSVWVNGTTPALYNSNQEGTADTFDSERIFLFAGLAKTYDITGRDADSVNSAKENTEFVKKSLRLRLDQESREWIRLRERYDHLLLKREIARERLQLMRKRDRGSAFADLNSLRGAQSMLAGIESSMEQLELEVWVWDDDKWK